MKLKKVNSNKDNQHPFIQQQNKKNWENVPSAARKYIENINHDGWINVYYTINRHPIFK